MSDICPWDPIRDSYGAPNVDWCESNLCSWVTEPANTWSNLAYVAVAVVLYMRRNQSNPYFPEARWLVPVLFALGWMSLIYHASTTFLLQILDFLGMFMLLGLPVVINLRRLGWAKSGAKAYVLWNAGMLGLLFSLKAAGVPYQGLIFIGILSVLFSEVALRRRTSSDAFTTPPLKHLGIAVGFLAIAVTFSALDVSRTWCNPSDHVLQGHAIWHVLSAISQVFVYSYYASFSAKNLEPA